MNEQISALLDDEIAVEDAGHLITAVQSNRQAAEAWGHYHLIGDAMRGTALFSTDFKQNFYTCRSFFIVCMWGELLIFPYNFFLKISTFVWENRNLPYIFAKESTNVLITLAIEVSHWLGL